MPAVAPIASAPTTFTDEHDGVMATRPATMPDAAPSEVGWPSLMRSVSSQPSMAAAVAIVVVMKVAPAMPLEPTADPALKPYHPNQSRPAPSITKGRLCGRMGTAGHPMRLPRISASTNPAMPALMCTAVPPAKSMALSLLAIQPPFSAVTPLKANTQCATGKYTKVDHSAAKASQPPNFNLSATAPEISATVMIANISWNATNTVCGMVPARGTDTSGASALACRKVPPIRPLSPKY